MQVTLPSDITALGEPLPIGETARCEEGTRLVLVIEEDGHQTLKIVRTTQGAFISATPNTYPVGDPRILGFFPIKGSKGVNTVVRPSFNINDKVQVAHQPDLGPCAVVERCALTDMEYLDGDVLTRVGFYVTIRSRKVKGDLRYHEGNLILMPQVQYSPEAA